MSHTATGFVTCEKPERYIQQLVSHWGHKMATAYDEGDGMGTFPFSEHTNAILTARKDGIAITLTTADQAENERMRGVIERHIDRFAFREAPLEYEWKDQ
ncbi:DUF2218 domain-containing protein [Aurantiacibacter sp. MUD11]|uniref:DUF2218 domain-containing protein n=1 Tax=Aurantiacibacter sp. MUD11 TaxID=3003265 RepID=UPI0022AAE22C|nr:DUF2218 domain-containing protein [Aurantiacibacter sp. MUD11]WAT16855.1 DUF2218 domain-containing protein [Aurantiacibacter sp. MUD11]